MFWSHFSHFANNSVFYELLHPIHQFYLTSCSQEGSHFGYYNYNPEVHKGESYLHLNIYDYHLEKLLHMLDSTSAPKSIILALQTLQTPAAIWILPCLLRLCLRSCDLQLTTLVGSYLHLRSCKLLPTCGSFCNSYAFQSERTAWLLTMFKMEVLKSKLHWMPSYLACPHRYI